MYSTYLRIKYFGCIMTDNQIQPINCASKTRWHFPPVWIFFFEISLKFRNILGITLCREERLNREKTLLYTVALVSLGLRNLLTSPNFECQWLHEKMISDIWTCSWFAEIDGNILSEFLNIFFSGLGTRLFFLSFFLY